MATFADRQNKEWQPLIPYVPNDYKNLYSGCGMRTDCSTSQNGQYSFILVGERGGSVVECRTPEREVGGSRPTAAVLCP